jgi:phosphinothricin acetyltransferase
MKDVSMNQTRFSPLGDENLSRAREIYNHYVRNSTATFHIQPVSPEEFCSQVRWDPAGPWQSWGIFDAGNQLLGYCSLGPYHSRQAYRYTGVVAIYLDPACTGKAIGKQAVGFLEKQALESDLHTLIALISSENTPSLSLFARLGYSPAGRLKEAGYKFGRYLDMISLQKMLPTGPSQQESPA